MHQSYTYYEIAFIFAYCHKMGGEVGVVGGSGLCRNIGKGSNHNPLADHYCASGFAILPEEQRQK